MVVIGGVRALGSTKVGNDGVSLEDAALELLEVTPKLGVNAVGGTFVPLNR